MVYSISREINKPSKIVRSHILRMMIGLSIYETKFDYSFKFKVDETILKTIENITDRFIQNDNTRYLLMYIHVGDIKLPIGYLGYELKSDHIHIASCYISEEHRNRGLFKNALNKIIKLYGRVYNQFNVEVVFDNIDSKTAYIKSGFEIEEEFRQLNSDIAITTLIKKF
ncbi:MAG: GNAT family N-acetyltransferase [Peptostreptococcaceae bacterium]